MDILYVVVLPISCLEIGDFVQGKDLDFTRPNCTPDPLVAPCTPRFFLDWLPYAGEALEREEAEDEQRSKVRMKEMEVCFRFSLI